MPNVPSELRQDIQTALDGTYAVERELADGGNAHLFVATEIALGRQVALKVLRPELRAAIDATRFRREMRLTAGLTHPNIVPILAAGEAGGFLYYTMPFLEGRSLRALLERHGELAVGDVVSILHDLAKALAYAHSRGIVHRDVKPDNVLVDHGTALLTDFGIAMALDAATIDRTDRRSTRRGVGTPMYVSPEQSTGDPRLDQRSDLYSLGVVAYEMLAGQPPFTYRTQEAMLAAHRTEVPSPIASRREGVPRWLAELVMRLLEKRPADRPQTAEEVLRVLDGGVTVPVAAPARRRPLARAAMFAIVVLASALSAYVWGQASRTPTRVSAAVQAQAAVRPVAPDDAIAVLAFATVGRDSLERLFADGLTDELTSSLAALGGLRVASHTSVAALQDRDVGAITIADSLRVGRVLEGTVARSGDRLRVTTQLTSANDGLALWSATYERSARDLFAAQDEIAGNIVRAVGNVGRSRPASNR
jgi:TolB-like protein/tRNA A-37 threonylcarbamoyl transferase component Bud32